VFKYSIFHRRWSVRLSVATTDQQESTTCT